MAWVGITAPGAQAVASLLQGFLPNPTLGQLDKANNALQQLRDTYVPHTFKAGFQWNQCKLLQISDSSLGNAGKKKSQGGFLVALAEDSNNNICGWFTLVSFRSAQSKRVANSTLCAEALAKLQGIETCLFLQTWTFELQNPGITAAELLKLDPSDLIPIESCTDCHDLYDVLMSPAAPNLTNLAITLHVAALRNEREVGRVRAWIWLDTEEMLANGLTKLNSDGTLPLELLQKSLRDCKWEPKMQFKYNNLRILPRQ